MSENGPRAKSAYRRGTDPVHIVDGGRRIVYWPSGTIGVGKRKAERSTPTDATARAEVVRAQVLRRRGTGPLSQAPLVEVMRTMVDHLERSGTPRGSISQYRSNWNVWVPEEVRTVACRDLEWRHWTAVFDGLTRSQASVGTIRAVARTMGTLVKFAVSRGYFDDAEPSTTPSHRAATVAEAVRAAKKRTNAREAKVDLAQCPTRQEVEQLATALEARYPRYGRRLILLAYASGMRIGELLALRSSAVHLTETTTIIDVDVQLDRAAAWPATKLPKGGFTRRTIVWRAYRDVVASLVEDADSRLGLAHGFLFPPTRWVKNWGRLAGDLIAEAATSCDFAWRLHWLRHAFASVSLAPPTVGGYGLDPASVQAWLGHQKPSTTLDFYVARQRDDAEAADMATAAKPPTSYGHAAPSRQDDCPPGGATGLGKRSPAVLVVNGVVPPPGPLEDTGASPFVFLNRPGMSGDSVAWEGWSHVSQNVYEVSGRAA